MIIPVRNEAVNIKRIINGIINEYDKYIEEIIIVDDNSTDGTGREVGKLRKKFKKVKLLHRNYPFGVGYAIRDGLKNISPESQFVLLMDSDFIINIPDIAKFIKYPGKFDGIVGSRFMDKNSLENYPFSKLVANRTYHLLARIFLGVKHTDLTNNFKFYKIGLIDKIYPFLSSSGFSINAQLGFYPVLIGAKIAQIPVRWKERTKQMGLSKFKILKVGPSYTQVLWELLIFRLGRI